MHPLPPPGSPEAAPPVARALAAAPPVPASRWSLPRVAALALALIGGAMCVVLLQLSYGAPRLGAALCAPTQSVNCDYVLASRWARIGPLSVSAIGLAYFAALAAWFAAIGRPNRAGRAWHLIPLFVGAAGFCGSIYFVYVMAVHLPVWCTWCLAAHGVNALLFFLIVGGWPQDRTEAAAPAYPSASRALTVTFGTGGFAVLLMAVIVAVGAQMNVSRIQTEYLKIANNVDYIEWRWRRAGVQDIPIRPDDLVAGTPGAAHTIVVFADFQCSACAAFHRYSARLLQRHRDVRIIFKHYPMSRACNPRVKESFHFFACEAARAMVAAAEVASANQASVYQARLFEHAERDRLDDRPYESIAEAVGLDRAKFTAVFSSKEPASRVADDIALAHRLGAESAPALFVDGRRLLYWHLLTNDAHAQVDLPGTEVLWDRILGRQPTKP